MITELYEKDRLLVNNFISNEITFEIQRKTVNSGGAFWTSVLTLSNEQIVSESLEITQSICDDEELQIGGCIPSQLKLNVMNISEDLSGTRIIVKIRENYYSDCLYPDADLFPNLKLCPYMQPLQTPEYVLFIGQIYSYKKTENYKIREIIAFDRMYYGSNVLCKNKLYNYLKPIWRDPAYSDVTITFKQIAYWFFSICRINAPKSSNFINWDTDFEIRDDLVESVLNKNFTAAEGLKWLCEINGVFLVDDETSGKNIAQDFANVRVIAPYNKKANKYEIESYSNLKYDDFMTKPIKYIQFCSNPDGSFYYMYDSDHAEYSHYISDNPLTQCLGSNDILAPLIRNLDANYASDKTNKIIRDIYVFRPFNASIFNRWWIQVGDRVKLPTSDVDVPYVESIVMSRTIKGINGMTVEIEAKGVEVFGKESDETPNE